MAKKLVVIETVADLRKEPQEILPKDFSHNDLRLTQLLYGERLSFLERQGSWIKVQALEQLCFSDERKWHPYEGWIHESEAACVDQYLEENFVVAANHVTLFPQQKLLTFGTKVFGDRQGNLVLPTGEKAYCDLMSLRPINEMPDRKQLCEDAKRFLDAPYLWGGKCFPCQELIASVDCSGLVYLCYRAQGINLPRDAYPQSLFGKEAKELLPGDAVYLSKGEKVTHVMMKIEGPYFIESPMSGKFVRLLKWNEDICEKEEKYWIKDRPQPYFPFFRTFM